MAPSRLGVFLRGFCMGTADAVPGVSGGTIALITGIYERLIDALTAVTPGRIRRVLLVPLPGRRADAAAAFREMDAPFLLVLGVGVLTAVVAVTSAIEVAVTEHPVPTFGFFFGLIAASAYVLAEGVSLDGRGPRGAAVAGFLLAFLVSGQASNALGHGLPAVFLAGAVAVSAMILPGISGSLLLLILGQYTYLVNTVSALRSGVTAALFGNGAGDLTAPALVAGVFVAGAVTGLFTVAHVVRRALAARREATLAFLVALVVGALRAPVERIDAALAAGGGWTAEAAAVVLATAAAGALAVVALERQVGAPDY
jgi:putative membrane protein